MPVSVSEEQATKIFQGFSKVVYGYLANEYANRRMLAEQRGEVWRWNTEENVNLLHPFIPVGFNYRAAAIEILKLMDYEKLPAFSTQEHSRI